MIWPSLLQLRIGLTITVVTALLALAAGTALRRLPASVDPNMRVLIQRGGLAFVAVLGLLAVVWSLGVTVIPAFLLGAVIASASLGLQGLLSNMFDGVYLLAERRFELGDMIAVGVGGAAIRGRVVDIGLRTTALRADDGHVMLIPNATMMSETVTLLQLREPVR